MRSRTVIASRSVSLVLASAAILFATGAAHAQSVCGDDPEKGDFTLDEATKGLKGPKDGALTAKIETSMGAFTCELFDKKSPKTVANFVGLANGSRAWCDEKTKKWETKKPFYNGLIFHRVIPSFMIQGGDPLGVGRGGPGYKFVNESDPSLVFDKPGVMAMANAGRDTNGSQFFITETPQPALNGGYTIFGPVRANRPRRQDPRASRRSPGDKPVKDVDPDDERSRSRAGKAAQGKSAKAAKAKKEKAAAKAEKADADREVGSSTRRQLRRPRGRRRGGHALVSPIHTPPSATPIRPLGEDPRAREALRPRHQHPPARPARHHAVLGQRGGHPDHFVIEEDRQLQEGGPSELGRNARRGARGCLDKLRSEGRAPLRRRAPLPNWRAPVRRLGGALGADDAAREPDRRLPHPHGGARRARRQQGRADDLRHEGRQPPHPRRFARAHLDGLRGRAHRHGRAVLGHDRAARHGR